MDAVYPLSAFSSSPSLPCTRKPDPSFRPPVITSNASRLFVVARPPGPRMHRIRTAWRRRAEPDSRTRKDPMHVERENGARRGDEEEEEEFAEELEELEEEAMAGRDEGRSPTDYGRRAHIFSESSRVFRALKERDGQPASDDGKNHRILRSE